MPGNFPNPQPLFEEVFWRKGWITKGKKKSLSLGPCTSLNVFFYTGSTASTSLLAWWEGYVQHVFTPQNLGSPATCEQRSFDPSNEKAEFLLFQDMPRWFCHLYPQYRLVLCSKWNALKKLKRCLFYFTSLHVYNIYLHIYTQSPSWNTAFP